MRKLIAFLLVISLALSGCIPKSTEISTRITTPTTVVELGFTGLSDPNLLRYIEDNVYADCINMFNSDEYFVENVSALYVSPEYLDELAFNSQKSVYFGFTLAEISRQFAGTKYVFTLDDDGQTTVKAFEAYDDTFDKVIRNVAVGTGVILLCVTISAVTAGVAPAVSVICAASAKSAATFALLGGVFSGISTGIITGVQTGDFDESIKAAALAGSEGFMWGAMTGTVAGGVGEAIALKGATLNGLTMNQAAAIQKESKYPLDMIKQFHSVEEADVFIKTAGLKPVMLNGRTTLVRGDIDLNLADEIGITNLQKLQNGQNPIYRAADGTVKTYEWHHVGQKADGTLALLTQDEHDNPILHGYIKASEIDRNAFARQRRLLNEAYGHFYQAGGSV